MRVCRSLVDKRQERHHVGPDLAGFGALEHVPSLVGAYSLESGTRRDGTLRRPLPTTAMRTTTSGPRRETSWLSLASVDHIARGAGLGSS